MSVTLALIFLGRYCWLDWENDRRTPAESRPVDAFRVYLLVGCLFCDHCHLCVFEKASGFHQPLQQYSRTAGPTTPSWKRFGIITRPRWYLYYLINCFSKTKPISQPSNLENNKEVSFVIAVSGLKPFNFLVLSGKWPSKKRRTVDGVPLIGY